MNRAELITATQLSLRASAAATVAVVAAQWMSLPYPLYALTAAIIVTDLSPRETRKHAVPRLAGTFLGASIGALFITAFHPSLAVSSVVTGLGVLTAMFLSHLCRLQEAAKVAGFVSGIVLLNHGDHPWAYAVYRLLETVLGIATAVAISFFPKLLGRERTSVNGFVRQSVIIVAVSSGLFGIGSTAGRLWGSS